MSEYTVVGNKILCDICGISFNIIANMAKFANDTFMNHLVIHTESSLSYHPGGLIVVANNAVGVSHCYGFLYFARLFPVLAMVRFCDDTLISRIAALYDLYPDHGLSTRSSMFNTASCVSPYFEYINEEFVAICHRMIMEANYYCGICGVNYEPGIPTVEVAWNHLRTMHLTQPLT